MGALGLAGCANKEGTGNEFTIRGEVVSVGEHSVKVDVRTIDDTSGEAMDRFEIDETEQVHDNYRSCGFLSHPLNDVGQEYDSYGNEMTLQDVQPGDIVELRGKVRDSYSTCGKSQWYSARAVYDTLTEIPQ